MDPRITRTRARLEQAMLDLLRTRDLDEITVAELVERAEVNRSTFYQHYQDKHDLVADAIDNAMEADEAQLPPLHLIEEEPPNALTHYLQHFEANADIYTRIFSEHGSPVAIYRLQRRIGDIAAVAIEHSRTHVFEDTPLHVAAAGLAGSVTAVLGAWLSLDPRPDVETAARWIWHVLTGPGTEED